MRVQSLCACREWKASTEEESLNVSCVIVQQVLAPNKIERRGRVPKDVLWPPGAQWHSLVCLWPLHYLGRVAFVSMGGELFTWARATSPVSALKVDVTLYHLQQLTAHDSSRRVKPPECLSPLQLNVDGLCLALFCAGIHNCWESGPSKTTPCSEEEQLYTAPLPTL